LDRIRLFLSGRDRLSAECVSIRAQRLRFYGRKFPHEPGVSVLPYLFLTIAMTATIGVVAHLDAWRWWFRKQVSHAPWLSASGRERTVRSVGSYDPEWPLMTRGVLPVTNS